MRIRFLITSLERGGAEKYLSIVARGLAAHGEDVGVGYLKGAGPVAEELIAAGLPCRRVGTDAVRWLRRERPDILYGFLFHATIGARMAGRLAGVPRIVSSEQLMEMERGARMWAYRSTWSLCDHYVAVAEAVRGFLTRRVGIPPQRITVIPSGLDPSAYPSAGRAQDGLVGSVGHLRLNDQKGYRILLQAAARLPQARFVIAGDGPLKAPLEAEARRLGLADRVRFVGAVEKIPEFLAPISLYVQPSRWEGFPNALLEAMACAKAVVASNVAGIPEQVEVGRTGILVKPDDPNALAVALGSLLADPRRRAAMGRAARQRVAREFSERRLVERHADLFHELLAKN